MAVDRKAGREQRSRFAARRILRRLIVASHLRQHPAHDAISSRCGHCGGIGHGRPHVVSGGADPLWVSTSSSGTHAVVALSRDSLGVDVESPDRLADLPRDGVARAVTGWRVAEAACPPGATPVQQWTALEALAKTTGRGLRATEDQLARAAQSHRLIWITGPGGLVTCVATSGAGSVETTDFVT